jgi:hypothetical protein
MFTLRFAVKEMPDQSRWTKRKLEDTDTLDKAFIVAEGTALEFMTSVHILKRGSGIVSQVDYDYRTHSTKRRTIGE